VLGRTAAIAEWFVSVCVCLLVTFVSPAEIAEPIKIPFGG